MKKMSKNGLIALLAVLLCLSFVFVACDGGKQPAQTTDPESSGDPGQEVTTAEPESGEQSGEQASDTDESTSEEATTEQVTEPAKTVYAVKVIGSDGAPRRGAMVCMYQNDAFVVQGVTDQDGVASFELESGNYRVALANVLGEKYDESGCELTPEQNETTILLYALPAVGEEIFAYNAGADDYIAYMANRISEGTTYVTLTSDDMTYYLFTAARGGTFRISADADLPISVGYYGSTFFVLTESASPEQDNAILIDVYDDMVFNYAFVIGIKAEEASLAECKLKVEYVSERETTPEDLPWNDVMPQGELVQFTRPAGALKNFDVTSSTLTAVYNENDGYYHVGSADGPLLMLNLDNKSPFMDALTTVCSNQRLGVYVYDDAGNVISKDSYNELIWAYNAVSDGGYYPLDKTLADMMIVVGNYMGWYDPSSPMTLFGAALVEPENVHLFACVYVQE